MELIHRSTSGHLPTCTFVLWDRGADVGFVQIRHRLSHGDEVPAQCASHVYYEVREDQRRRGYGTKLLELGMAEARRIGIKELIVGCFATNPASRKIIEKNGGIIKGEWKVGKDNKITTYKIMLD